MKRKIRRGAAAMLAVTLGAASALPVAAHGPSVLRAARGLPSSGIDVVEDRAVVVESAVPFVEVSVAQPSIADISPLSDRSIYVFGRSRGTTTLTVMGEGGELITNALIRVTPDLAQLEAAIEATRDRP